jgi:hypothetical protein
MKWRAASPRGRCVWLRQEAADPEGDRRGVVGVRWDCGGSEALVGRGEQVVCSDEIRVVLDINDIAI